MMERHPDLEIINILDDSLLADTLKVGDMPPEVARRIVSYAYNAELAGADAIMLTCTSVNKASALAKELIKTPIFNIDEPMAKAAVKAGSKIGIIASVPTSPNGTKRLLNEEARKAGKEIELKVVINEDAFSALMAGDTEEHNRIIHMEMDKLAAEVDVIVLGQISLARIEYNPGKPVFQVGKSGYEEAERILYGV
jgi:Asp/Glu/hydantoin racemase